MGILDGKVAIIVGASSGVGYGCALRYAEEGAHVVAAARRLNKLEELKADVEGKGFTGTVLPVQCDIYKEDDLDNLVDVAVKEYGHIDVLACIAQGALNDQHDLEHTDTANALSFFKGGPVYTLYLTQKVRPIMAEQGKGKIITCASGAGIRYTPHTTSYGMAKAAIISLTKTIAMEYGKYGIRCNCFLPVIQNDFFDKAELGKDDPGIPVSIMKMLSPIGKMDGSYADGSPMLAWLGSDQSDYINGQVFEIDGGIGQTSPATVLTGLAAMKQEQQ